MKIVEKVFALKKVSVPAIWFFLTAVAAGGISTVYASQNDYVISDDSGAAVLADLNSAFQALVSHNLGATAPVTKYQGMTWLDSSTSPWTLRRWNGADWVPEAAVDSTNNITTPYIGAFPANADRFRNRLANGDMYVDQIKMTHYPGAAHMIQPGVWTHTVDLWQAITSGASITGQQVAAPSGAKYRNAYRLVGAQGCTLATFLQRIPGEDVADLVNLPAKLQASLCSSGSVTVNWSAYTANALNDFSNITLFASGSFATTASPTLFTADLTMPANASNGIEIVFQVGPFASGTLTITGVQLEAGKLASLFEFLPAEQAIHRCQRQYVVVDEYLSLPSAGWGGYSILFPTPMRVVPGAPFALAPGTFTNATIQSETSTGRSCTLVIQTTAPAGGISGRIIAYSALL